MGGSVGTAVPVDTTRPALRHEGVLVLEIIVQRPRSSQHQNHFGHEDIASVINYCYAAPRTATADS